METNKLKTFVDLAQTLSFSKTAEDLYITQSSVSKQIHSLEKELQVTLFNRSNKHVELSQAGKIILPDAQAMLQEEEKLTKKLQQLKQQRKETIKMAVIPTFSTYFPFKLISHYMNVHPEIDFQLKETETNQMAALLKEGKVDLAFARSLKKEQPFEAILTRKEKFALCVAQDDPLAQNKKINLKDIQGESFIMLAQSSMLYQPVVDLCREAGFEPNIIFTSDRISSIIEMIRNHQGVSILMDPSVNIPGVRFIPIQPTITSYLYLLKANHKKYSSAIEKLWQYLQQHDYSKQRGKKNFLL